MSTGSFSFGDDDQEWRMQEPFAEFIVDEGQMLFTNGPGGESPFQALLEDSEHDHLTFSMPQNAHTITNSSPSLPDEPLRIITPPSQPGQTVHHLHQCIIDHKVCTFKGPVKRRVRGPDWSVEEKRAYLKLKEEALGAVKGKDWDFISHKLEKQHGFRRSAKCCEDLWGTLRKAFKLIRGHEKDYWEMDADGRARNKLPKSFPKDCFTTMKGILAAQELRSGINSKLQISYTKTPANKGDDDQDINTDKELEYLQIKQLVSSAFQRLSDTLGLSSQSSKSGKGQSCSPSPLVEMEAALLTLLPQLVEEAVKSAPPIGLEACIGPQLVTKCIMDALHSSLVRPVASALRDAVHQKDLEDEARLKTIEENRRALDREELQIKRQRLGRAGPSKGRGKKIPISSVAEGTAIASWMLELNACD